MYAYIASLVATSFRKIPRLFEIAWLERDLSFQYEQNRLKIKYLAWLYFLYIYMYMN
jgi:hypothetical protein